MTEFLYLVLQNHETSFLHPLVVFLGYREVFSRDDGMVGAFCILSRLQIFSLAAGDPSLPSLGNVVGGRLWNPPRQRKAFHIFLFCCSSGRSVGIPTLLWHLSELAGSIGAEENFALGSQEHRLGVVAVWRDTYFCNEDFVKVFSYF